MSDDPGRTSILLFGIQMTARVTGFVGLAYFTKVLPPESLDVYFLFFVVVQVASMVSNLGLGQALVRRISERHRPGGIFTAALLVLLGVGLAATGAFYLAREPLGAYIGADVPALLSLATTAWLVADVYLRTLQGEDRVLTAGSLQLVQDVVRVVAGAALVTTYGPLGLMVGVVVGFLSTVVGGQLLTDVPFAVPVKSDFTRLFSISKYTMFFGPTNFVYFWLDTLMIGLLLPPGNVSPYEVAWQTSRVLIIATSAINQTIFPKVSAWASDGKVEEIERILPGAVIFTLVFPLPGVVGVVVIGEDVLSVVYRPAYAVAALPMVLLAGYMVVESLQRVVNSTLIGMDRADIPFRSRIVGVTLAVVLNVVLIGEFGLIGAAAATFTAKLVDTVLQWSGLWRLLAVRVPGRAVGWEVVSALVMGAVVYAGSLMVPPTDYVPLFGLVGLGVVVYGAVVVLDPDIRQVVENYLPVRLPIPR